MRIDIEQQTTILNKQMTILKSMEKKMDSMKTGVDSIKGNWATSILGMPSPMGPSPLTTIDSSRELIIANVPYKKEEDLKSIVRKIAKKKEMTIYKTDYTVRRMIRRNDQRDDNQDKPPIIELKLKDIKQ